MGFRQGTWKSLDKAHSGARPHLSGCGSWQEAGEWGPAQVPRQVCSCGLLPSHQQPLLVMEVRVPARGKAAKEWGDMETGREQESGMLVGKAGAEPGKAGVRW